VSRPTYRTIALLLVLAGGCDGRDATPRPTQQVPPGPPADLAGDYDGGSIQLTLEADGAYEAMVWNGMTIDGCGTFAGAGLSRGTWRYDGEAVSFAPREEPDDLVFRFGEARAVPNDAGLVLTSGEKERVLPRSEERADADRPAAGDGPVDRR